jgi:hypothetical protein
MLGSCVVSWVLLRRRWWMLTLYLADSGWTVYRSTWKTTSGRRSERKRSTSFEPSGSVALRSASRLASRHLSCSIDSCRFVHEAMAAAAVVLYACCKRGRMVW